MVSVEIVGGGKGSHSGGDGGSSLLPALGFQVQDLLLFQASDNYIDPATPDTQPSLPPAPAQVGTQEDSCVDSSCSMTRNELGVRGYPEFRAALDVPVAPVLQRCKRGRQRHGER